MTGKGNAKGRPVGRPLLLTLLFTSASLSLLRHADSRQALPQAGDPMVTDNTLTADAHGAAPERGKWTLVEDEIYQAWLDGRDVGFRKGVEWADRQMTRALEEAVGGFHSYGITGRQESAKSIVHRLARTMHRGVFPPPTPDPLGDPFPVDYDQPALPEAA